MGWSADESSQTGNTIKGAWHERGSGNCHGSRAHGPEDLTRCDRAMSWLLYHAPPGRRCLQMAAGIVTDIGGPPSQRSIVARNMASAGDGHRIATKRIHSGQVIAVDGSTGIITLSDDKQE
jgi:pyruvate,water dikinase